VAKLAVIAAAVEETSVVVVAAAVIAGALTVLSMSKIWLGVFWGARPDGVRAIPTAIGNRLLMWGSTSLAVLGTLIIAAIAGSLFDLSIEAAEDLLNPTSYIAEVGS